jgi:hypothetical protein
MKDLERYRRMASSMTRDGRKLSEHPIHAAALAELEADLEALQISNLRMLANARDGAASPIDSSLLKLKGTQLRQDILALMRSARGPDAAFWGEAPADTNSDLPPHADHVAPAYFNNRKLSIFGGSNEIQRNIVAQTLFR